MSALLDHETLQKSNGKAHFSPAELDNLDYVDIEQEMPPAKDDRLYELLERRFDEDRRRFEEDRRQSEDRHKELMLTISNGGGRAYYQIIKGWFKGIAQTMDNGEFLANEVEENGWLQEPDALVFLQEQESDCQAFDDACAQFVKALDTFHTNQMARNDRMRRWIDKMLSQPPVNPPTP